MNLIAKILGSLLGASIVTIFKGTSLVEKIGQMWVGTIGGIIFAPFIIDWMKWQHTFDYWMTSGALGGLFTYVVLKYIFNQNIFEKIFEKILTKFFKH